MISLKPSISHIAALSELFINLSSGFFGLVFIAPVVESNVLAVAKNLSLGLAFYFLSVWMRR